jgi:hypothetical protein
MPFVYHGTDAEHVDEILENGLQLREATGRSNWSQNNMESLPGHVYLSRLYALYFGLGAVDSWDEPIAVYEIDLDRIPLDSLYPDEDFIEQGIRNPDIDIENPDIINEEDNIIERTESVRDNIDQYKDY